MRSSRFRPLAQCGFVAIVSFMAGATLFARAQTTDQQQAVERAQSAMRRGGFESRFRDGALVSPDGNFVVFDLGEAEQYGAKTRAHAVYDFAAKKVFWVRFIPSANAMRVESEALR